MKLNQELWNNQFGNVLNSKVWCNSILMSHLCLLRFHPHIKKCVGETLLLCTGLWLSFRVCFSDWTCWITPREVGARPVLEEHQNNCLELLAPIDSRWWLYLTTCHTEINNRINALFLFLLSTSTYICTSYWLDSAVLFEPSPGFQRGLCGGVSSESMW